MTVQETQTPLTPTFAPARRRSSRIGAWQVWSAVAVAVVALSLLLVLWARTRPGYDPYGWLIWGYQTVHGTLNLGGAPSWKPLPWLFTVPYSLFGHYALWLWMVTAVSVSLAAVVFGARIAYRLTGGGGYPAIIAAVFGGAAVLGIQSYMHYILSAQSDPMIVTCCLAALDCHLSRRPRWAFALLVLASLGRPEAWPWLALYALWAWRTVPSMRPMVYAGLTLVPVLWFGVPTITNHRPLIAGQLAELSPRHLHQNEIIGTIDRFAGLQYLPIEVAALVAIAVAVYRRNRPVLVIAAGGALWLAVEIALVLHGWPGVGRYMFEPAAVMAVLAAVAVGWVLREARRVGPGVLQAGALALVALFAGVMVPNAISQMRTEHRDLVHHERARTVEINKLNDTLQAVGGYKRVRACGQPVTDVEYASVLSWYVRLNTGQVGYQPASAVRQGYPIVLFTALPNGWAVQPFHTPPASRGVCAAMNGLYVPTARHPQGVFVPR